MHKSAFPILEFDAKSTNLIEAKNNIRKKMNLPKYCVLSFFGDEVRKFVKNNKCTKIGDLVLESFKLPIYKYSNEDNIEIAIFHALAGGPYAAGQIEKLIAMGGENFIVCGGCGILDSQLKTSKILIPNIALRDEGTSYHYVEPSRFISIDEQVKNNLCDHLNTLGIEYKLVKTWTTDAIYRETINLINLRKEEGCEIVEMECASFFAVSQYKKVKLAVLLYSGDDLSSSEWQNNNWKNNKTARQSLIELSLKCVVSI